MKFSTKQRLINYVEQISKNIVKKQEQNVDKTQKTMYNLQNLLTKECLQC